MRARSNFNGDDFLLIVLARNNTKFHKKAQYTVHY